MSDFSCNVKENIKRLETSLNVERNFDILQREVIIAVLLFVERIGHNKS